MKGLFCAVTVTVCLCIVNCRINYVSPKRNFNIPKPIDMVFPEKKTKEKPTSQPIQSPRCQPCPYKKGPKSPVCEATVDIGFAVESSTSLGRVGPGNLHRLIHFVGLIARKFQLSKKRARVGLVTYATKPYLLFGMTERVGKIVQGLKRGLSKSYKDKSANTGKALKFAQKMLFKNSRRFNKVLVVITDGKSNDTFKDAVRSLKREGVKILCVGVGRYFDIKQLNEMSSRPVQEHVFTGEFTKLIYLRDEIKKAICHGVGGILVSPDKRPCLCKTG